MPHASSPRPCLPYVVRPSNTVDYEDIEVSEEQALEAVEDAERFVNAVDEWLRR